MTETEIIARTAKLYTTWAELLAEHPHVGIRGKVSIDSRIRKIRLDLAKLQQEHYDLFFKK